MKCSHSITLKRGRLIFSFILFAYIYKEITFYREARFFGVKWPKSGTKFKKMAQKNQIGETGGERKKNLAQTLDIGKQNSPRCDAAKCSIPSRAHPNDKDRKVHSSKVG